MVNSRQRFNRPRCEMHRANLIQTKIDEQAPLAQLGGHFFEIHQLINIITNNEEV